MRQGASGRRRWVPVWQERQRSHELWDVPGELGMRGSGFVEVNLGLLTGLDDGGT